MEVIYVYSKDYLKVGVIRISLIVNFKPLKTKRRPLYLKTQFVPRSKHFSSQL